MKDIAKYLFEMGALKRVSRTGWWLAGIQAPETVAEHSFRAGLIAYLLASLEGADAPRCATMALFHDTSEARLNDLHKVAQNYLETKDAEKQVHRDQLSRLPAQMAADLGDLLLEMEARKTREAVIVHDADLLECLFQAHEYQAQGYPVDDWIDTCRAGLQTASAQQLAEACLSLPPSSWWDGYKA